MTPRATVRAALCAFLAAGLAACALPMARQGAIDDCEHRGKPQQLEAQL
jgi:hypothetical protein